MWNAFPRSYINLHTCSPCLTNGGIRACIEDFTWRPSLLVLFRPVVAMSLPAFFIACQHSSFEGYGFNPFASSIP